MRSAPSPEAARAGAIGAIAVAPAAVAKNWRRDKDGDIFGDGVNIAVRLEGLAEPGGICISHGVHDHVRRKLPYGFEDLGEQSVKNTSIKRYPRNRRW